jgi:Zn finger protein HypA/HybF involved in hydrogenase expression
MSAIRVIAYIAAAILIFFGVLFIWGAFSPQGSPGWILVGAISVAVGFGLIVLAGAFGRREAAAKQELIQKIELSGDINLEKLTCRNCGGALSSDNIKMLAGAPVVRCPYCGTSYQLTEEPKW